MPHCERPRTRSARRTAFIDPYETFGLDPAHAVAGVDEAGRGALAGPVTAAAVLLDAGADIPGLADSKTMTPAQRVRVAETIRQQALAIAVSHVPADVIDACGIAEATRRAMLEAIAGLSVRPHAVVVDGLPVDLGIESHAIVRGDSLVAAVAAASIVAKVSRDALMAELDGRYPGYGFAVHKGYGTRDHMATIERFGPCPIHRRSFSPCAQARLF